MEINQEKIERLYKIQEEYDTLEIAASDAIKEARLNEGNEVTITRGGKDIQIAEKLLWDEVWNLGGNCEAGQFLRSKYPEAFAKSDDCNQKAQELKDFSLAELGIDSQKIKLSTVLKLIEAVVAMKLSK